MSVKDKIAMWNSLATASAPPPPVPKIALSANNPTKEPTKEKLPSSQNQEKMPPPVISTNFKKTDSIESSSPSLPTQTDYTSPSVDK